MMKYILWLVHILWIISIPVLIISSTVRIYTGSLDLYRYGFTKYNISQVTRISDLQLEEAAKMMIAYFDGKSSTPQITVDKDGKPSPLYNEKELIHLEDVRAIVDVFKVLQVISLILFVLSGLIVIFKARIQKLLRGLKIGSIITIGFTGLLISWALIDFNSMFYLFHIVSFSNDLWILDPSRDYLIMMFPEGFFNDAAILMVSTILIAAVILLIMSVMYKKYFKAK